MSIREEFKEFALKGNVVDLAIGLMVGAAFGKVVSSMVDDVLMPPIGLLIGGVDFSKLQIVLRHGKPDVAIRYGLFIQNSFNFLIIAWATFLIVKLMNRLRR